jgi:hypothetical protein
MKPWAFLLYVLAIPLGALGAEAGYATRDVELRAQPVAGASVVGTVQKGARFEIVGEQKAWAQIKAGELTGWTLLFYVMKGDPPAAASAGRTLSELWNMGTDRAGKGQITSTIGVRGIDEEELKAAKFNAEELRRLEGLLLPKQAGDSFAKDGHLASKKVDYLPDPAAAADSGSR